MIRLDDRDMEILRVLSTEGRISKAELARRINLSATPAWERLRRLEKAGVIRGYRADIALPEPPRLTVFVTVELEHHRAADLRGFESAVAVIEEIRGAWSLGGGFDYLLQVEAADIVAYQALIDRLIEGDLGISRYFTYVVTKEVKRPGPTPLSLLAGEEGSARPG